MENYPYPVKEDQQYINLNSGRIFVQQPPKKGKGTRGSRKPITLAPTTCYNRKDNYHTARQDSTRWENKEMRDCPGPQGAHTGLVAIVMVPWKILYKKLLFTRKLINFIFRRCVQWTDRVNIEVYILMGVWPLVGVTLSEILNALITVYEQT